MSNFRVLLLIFSLYFATIVAAQRSGNRTSSWKTLKGSASLVIAKGGFSGIFPDSSSAAYNLALSTSLPNVILWCDVQLTKDGAGICLPDLKVDNATDISDLFKNRSNVYLVNGVSTRGWFSVDFTLNELSNIFLTQGVFSRSPRFNGNQFTVLTVENVASLKPPGLWLNIQHNEFFMQHNLSMRNFVLSVSRRVIINYISSPEVDFLKSIKARFERSRTRLIFRFLELGDTEPSTNQTYGSLLKNLTFIKTFASGILVPKTYIWPVNMGLYLLPHTSVVSDAHREGLEVFASGFANDITLSYNYSYDPRAEYLSFVDNDNFSVDGVLSDFPITPSATIDCFSHISQNSSKQVLSAKPLVISNNGASGDYPGCTDLSYKKAISDSVEILDCTVQMTKDGIPFCLGSINLMDGTTVAQSQFNNLSTIIREIQGIPGIFSFNLTWNDIQKLSPAISNPSREYNLIRNPAYKNAGSFVTLDDFLGLAKNMSNGSGVLISIENAAFLAEQGLSVTDAVLDALRKSGYNQTTKKVMIQSTHSSVLIKLKEKTNYELVYKVDESIRDALNSTIEDIKRFADSVAISKESVFPENQFFLLSVTDVVPKLHSFNLSVYVYPFRNEFVSQAWDFYSDAIVEFNTYVTLANIDGVITDFPGTAAAYKRNRCLNMGDNTPIYMSPVHPGSLFQVITSQYLPPTEAPLPVLTDSDVAESPLPPVSKLTSNIGGNTLEVNAKLGSAYVILSENQEQKKN